MLRLADQVRAVRCMGSVALELCAVADGAVDIFAGMRSSPWDHNAARLILLESGCRICALGEEDLPVDRACSVFACRNETVFAYLKDACGFCRK
jgi:fructose-1,6-bisphosphatase/inositol monophosphatase family enzyme